MFPKLMLVAAISGCVASTSFGGFVVTRTVTSVDATFDRMDLFALNTGGDTGTGLVAVELTSNATAGVAVFRSTSAGNWNPLNSADTANRSQVRVDPEDVSSSSLVSKTPSANQPLAPQYGPSTVALGNFSVVIASLSGAIPPQSPTTGNLFASLFVSKNYAFSSFLSGFVGGSAGPKVPFLLGGDLGNTPPTVVSGSTANVVFGQIVSNGSPFSVVVNVVDAEVPLQALSLAVGSVAGISNVSVTPSSATSPASFTVTGTVDYSLNGTTVVVPVTASDGTLTGTGSFSLVVTPEPGMLSVLAASGFVRRRR